MAFPVRAMMSTNNQAFSEGYAQQCKGNCNKVRLEILKGPHDLILSGALSGTPNSGKSLLRKPLSRKCRRRHQQSKHNHEVQQFSINNNKLKSNIVPQFWEALSFSKREVVNFFHGCRSSFPLKYQQQQQYPSPPQVVLLSRCVVDLRLESCQLQGRVCCQQDIRDQSIACITVAQALESSRSLVKLGIPAGMGGRAHQTGREICNG